MKISIFHNLIFFFFFLRTWRLFGSSRKCQKLKKENENSCRHLWSVCWPVGACWHEFVSTLAPRFEPLLLSYVEISGWNCHGCWSISNSHTTKTATTTTRAHVSPSNIIDLRPGSSSTITAAPASSSSFSFLPPEKNKKRKNEKTKICSFPISSRIMPTLITQQDGSQPQPSRPFILRAPPLTIHLLRETFSKNKNFTAPEYKTHTDSLPPFERWMAGPREYVLK